MNVRVRNRTRYPRRRGDVLTGHAFEYFFFSGANGLLFNLFVFFFSDANAPFFNLFVGAAARISPRKTAAVDPRAFSQRAKRRETRGQYNTGTDRARLQFPGRFFAIYSTVLSYTV